MDKSYPCPCCGFLTLSSSIGSHEICPVCYWEDDLIQSKEPTCAGGANNISLESAKENYKKYGACAERFKFYTRKPTQREIVDKK